MVAYINNKGFLEFSDVEKEFEKEALPHVNELHSYALKLTRNQDDAADLIQEAYLKAYRFFDNFKKGTNCKAWLYTILRNTFINNYHKAKREPIMIDYDEIGDFYESIKPEHVNSNDLDSDFYNDLFDDEITGAIDKLPDSMRRVLILSDIEGMTYQEITDTIGCPIGTVRSRLHRARKFLQTRLHDYAKDKGYSIDTEQFNNSSDWVNLN